MLSLEEIKRKKKEYGLTNEMLSKLSGVPLGTVQKTLGNVTKSPRVETVSKLSSVFEKKKITKYKINEAEQSLVEEPETAYAINSSFLSFNTHQYDKQGSYTIEDYITLPDNQRAELIDGVIYDMGAPSSVHQLIAGEVFFKIRDYINKNKGECVPMMAPMDVQLDLDNRTIVQPDLMIICDHDKIHKRILGAPDFVAEILSPATKGKDILIKGAKYQNAGVKEYWLIDPDEKMVTVFDFRSNVSMKVYSFDEKIPMLIYDGKLKIDMKEIDMYVKNTTKND